MDRLQRIVRAKRDMDRLGRVDRGEREGSLLIFLVVPARVLECYGVELEVLCLA